jgi:pimeloyl-ACP methyl ester carboxylesterase
MEIKKKKKTPLVLKMVRTFYPITEFLFPWLARKWALKLFFTPFRFPLNPEERKFVDSCEVYKLPVQDINIKVYAKGSGPVIICQHGWSGCAAQLHIIADALVKKGFKVVLADAPGHGGSEGNRTDLPEITDILAAIATRYKKERVAGYLGHSLGGAAILYGIGSGQLDAQKLALIATPSHPDNILRIFTERIKASNKCPKYIESFIEAKYGRRLEDFFIRQWTERRPIQTLIMHDTNDKELPKSEHLPVLESQLPNHETSTTSDLGHFRIITDKKVALQVADFMSS